MKRHAPETLAWDWGPAVLAYGILDLYEATGDSAYRTYVEAWARHHARGYKPIWSDNVAPIAAATRVARWSCDPELLALSDRAWLYLTEEAPRTPSGGISHLGIFASGSVQLWVDSLFMFGSFLLERGRTLDDPAVWDLFASQIRIFSVSLQDAGGFFRHALIEGAPVPSDPVFWARGNGWIANIVPRFLEVMPRSHVERSEIERIASRLLSAVVATQDEGGLWWTVLNRPGESYLETSATALFADGLIRGAALGLVDEADAAVVSGRALSAIKGRIIRRDGMAVVGGTSTGTVPGSFEKYAAVPQKDDVDYGLGAVLMALTSPK
ncbi:MAG: glycoside hydrolase family 88 protein [Nitrospirae bacterium]|nr:glycoside hydrolase family 88 protein [Nitrospirota bacterium]